MPPNVPIARIRPHTARSISSAGSSAHCLTGDRRHHSQHHEHRVTEVQSHPQSRTVDSDAVPVGETQRRYQAGIRYWAFCCFPRWALASPVWQMSAGVVRCRRIVERAFGRQFFQHHRIFRDRRQRVFEFGRISPVDSSTGAPEGERPDFRPPPADLGLGPSSSSPSGAVF